MALVKIGKAAEMLGEKAWRLRDAMIARSGTLSGVAHDLKVAAQQAEMRQMRWRAGRPRWQPARGDKPRPSALERSERRRQQRGIARPVTQIGALLSSGPKQIETGNEPRQSVL
jgi:hypothetical protein